MTKKHLRMVQNTALLAKDAGALAEMLRGEAIMKHGQRLRDVSSFPVGGYSNARRNSARETVDAVKTELRQALTARWIAGQALITVNRQMDAAKGLLDIHGATGGVETQPPSFDEEVEKFVSEKTAHLKMSQNNGLLPENLIFSFEYIARVVDSFREDVRREAVEYAEVVQDMLRSVGVEVYEDDLLS